jgi:hypothetical protein
LFDAIRECFGVRLHAKKYPDLLLTRGTTMQPLSIGECISYGWETFKKRPWILIGGFLLAMIIATVPGMFGPQPEITPDGQIIPPPPSTYGTLVAIVSIIVSILVSLGLTTFSLRAHDNIETVQIADLWNPGPFLSFLIAYILTVLAIAVGFLLLIIPGFIVAMGLAFVPYLVVDRGLGPIEAMKESWRITKGHKWRLFLLFLALLGINLLGVLALIVGVFVSMPVTMISFEHAYRTLSRVAGVSR